MRISKLTIGILVSMILFSIFFTNVVNLLSTDALTPEKFTKDNYIKITDTAQNLIWFLQISDLHISIFRDPLRITEFKEFCHYTVDAIKPRVVLASGDLTDAKTKDAIGSEQFRDEWKYYRDILNESHMREKTLWLDIRGNHDNFNVADAKSKQNFFTNYSVQGKDHPRSYMYQIKNGNTLYSFIAVDACLEPDNSQFKKYRLLAIDHGLLSFVDVSHRDWPVILITNPKHALFVNPAKENLHNIQNSTHIRVLAFSLSRIDFVKVRIDKETWLYCKHVEGPLYVARWNPQRYLKGVHKIEVYVKDMDGRIKSEIQPFCLDGTQLSFGILARLALMTDASVMFRVMFFTMLVISILPLCLVRYAHTMVTTGRIIKPRTRRNCCSAWLRKIWIMSTVDRIFWPIVLYPVYLTFGPWSIGYIVEDHLGTIFAWGIFCKRSLFTWLFHICIWFHTAFRLSTTINIDHGQCDRPQISEYHFQTREKSPHWNSDLSAFAILHCVQCTSFNGVPILVGVRHIGFHFGTVKDLVLGVSRVFILSGSIFARKMHKESGRSLACSIRHKQ
ncbi:hypothetical protein NQ314_020444 [Rhamnusium bicolor]|uniref:Calcineurin-like phosphoesterase domain-containing protein n=1 Tax=Rhamnusium bicolor TaxID=1586634 RepID=A0AAV8WLF5_9CUCU|nr:hypothetical protein NQ314_020444 [Rhamnusium bicolor]